MRRQHAACLALVVAFASTQAALGASGDPQKRHTAADTQLAANALLKRGDLGSSGWNAARSAASNESSCGIVTDLQPKESDLVETGAASGSLFTNHNQALTQSALVFASRRQANAAWMRTVTKNLVICMEQQVEGTSSMGAPVSVIDWRRLNLPRSAEHVAGFRVIATAKTSAKATAKIYLDLILLGQSRTMTRLSFSSLQKPFSTSYETRLAGIVSQRLTR